jgi:hypothetical protein
MSKKSKRMQKKKKKESQELIKLKMNNTERRLEYLTLIMMDSTLGMIRQCSSIRT